MSCGAHSRGALNDRSTSSGTLAGLPGNVEFLILGPLEARIDARAVALGAPRQRLLLARALLAAPHVLVLDEPTAHLDTDTEREVLADLLDATAGRTVLISTHRRLRPGQVDATLRIDSGALVLEPVPAR